MWRARWPLAGRKISPLPATAGTCSPPAVAEVLSDHCPISTSGAYLWCNRTLLNFLYACLSEIFCGMLCKAVCHQKKSDLQCCNCRQKAALKRDSSRDEDALNGYLFELVKAGRISQAARTCVDCGQSWRAASLLGGGPNGPTPLGDHTNRKAYSDKIVKHTVACGTSLRKALSGHSCGLLAVQTCVYDSCAAQGHSPVCFSIPCNHKTYHVGSSSSHSL